MDEISIEDILMYARAVATGFGCDVVIYGNAAMAAHGLRSSKNAMFMVDDDVYSMAARVGYEEVTWSGVAGGHDIYIMHHPRLPIQLLSDARLPGLDMQFLDARGRSDKLDHGVHVLELDAMLDVLHVLGDYCPCASVDRDVALVRARISELDT